MPSAAQVIASLEEGSREKELLVKLEHDLREEVLLADSKRGEWDAHGGGRHGARRNQGSTSSALMAEDVLALSEFQVMSRLGVGAEDARRVLSTVAKSLVPALCTAKDLLDHRKQNAQVLQPLEVLALQPGYLIEVVGRAGAGKTQICLSSAVDVVGLHGRGCVYVDTENKFSVERVLEIIRCRIPGAREDKALEERLASLIHVYSPQSAQKLVATFEDIETTLLEKNVGLIVLDSIASLTRHEHRYGGDIGRRQRSLALLASRLKFLAESLSIPVLITNQVTLSSETAVDTPFRTADAFGVSEEGSGTAAPNSSVAMQPALGNTWSHCINVRVVVNTQVGTTQRTAQIVKSPDQPEFHCTFMISALGVEEP
mmetsp:Transcript_21533/g.40204  ORF Transcript_21533/g.40204 Transcript_21533/m.40204 type:complete len:372 (+) Transcript_21533:65-1180(+)